MAVIKATIKAALLALYVQCESGPGIDKDQFADGLADIIKNAVLSADVNTTLTALSANVIATGLPATLPVNGGTSTGGLT